MIKRQLLFWLTVISFSVTNAQTSNLDENFLNPPASAKPITWMHVMSGNMSKEGMTKDLEAIADAGIGGIILFNVTHNIPNGPVVFNSPQDIALKAHTAAECERLGLNFGIHNCDGWTSSGGPWVAVEHSMKQVVYRNVVVDGGEIDMFLPGASQCGGFYKDIAIIAYPALPSEIEDTENKPVITSSNPDFDINIATNGKIDERAELTVKKGGKSWIQWNFDTTTTIRSLLMKSENQRTKVNGVMLKPGEKPRKASFYLQTSEDGIHFKDVKKLNILRHGKYEYTIDEVFDGITGHCFRFTTDLALDIEEISLNRTLRFNNMTARTCIRRTNNGGLPKLKNPNNEMIVKREDIINLTANINNGKLKTTLPEGKWTIMRVGYTTTKAINDPASIAGTGYEVDKFSRKSFKLFYDGYVQRVVDASKKVAPNAMQWVEIDSYEVGSQNWTKGYEKLFKEHFSYDIMDFLPLFAGRFIDNAETTERILWDLRNFNSQLMSENYFDYFTELCHKDGLKSYVEPYGNACFNTLDASRTADITMGEFHLSNKYMTLEAISAGHIYGKNIISAEAFTSGPKQNYNWLPADFKPIGDKALGLGINEFCFHRYAHQANTHVKPGMTMSGFSSNIERTQTWWNNAGKEWFKYIARAQYLLRQGFPVSDLLVFVGDGSPNTVPKRRGLGKLPNTINFDGVNMDVLQNRVTVKNGKLLLPEGNNYHALYLSNSREMRLSSLKRIAEFAEQGVIIIGNKPNAIGGYLVSDKDKREFKNLVHLIWSKPTTVTEVNWNKIYEQFKLPIDLHIKDGENINYVHRKTPNEDIYYFYNPDKEKRIFECTFNVNGKMPEWFDPMTGKTTKLAAFEHKNGKTTVAVPMKGEGAGFILFRGSSSGLNQISVETAMANPELNFYLNKNNQPEVLATKNGSYELTFNNGNKRQIAISKISDPIIIDGNWQVAFPNLKEGTKTLSFPTLSDWTKHSDEEIKHYSGTAIYSKTFNVSKKILTPDNKIILDLGKVHEIARVMLNGKDLGVIWKAPHTVDISSAVKAGKNNLQIELTNQWTNRLIGDENFPNLTGYDIRPQINKPEYAKDPHLTLINRYKMVDWYVNNEPAPLGQRSTFCTYPFYKKGDKLLPAGLLGSVKITVYKIFNSEAFSKAIQRVK